MFQHGPKVEIQGIVRLLQMMMLPKDGGKKMMRIKRKAANMQTSK